jgi:hypothetical protein
MATCRSLQPANSVDMATSHDEDPRVKFSKKRAFAELLGYCKKVCEWVHDRPEGAEFKRVLMRWQPQEEGEEERRILNPAVVKGKGRPRRVAGVPPLAKPVNCSQTSVRSLRPVVCSVCGGGHKRNNRKCPMFGQQVGAGSEADEGGDNPCSADPGP